MMGILGVERASSSATTSTVLVSEVINLIAENLLVTRVTTMTRLTARMNLVRASLRLPHSLLV